MKEDIGMICLWLPAALASAAAILVAPNVALPTRTAAQRSTATRPSTRPASVLLLQGDFQRENEARREWQPFSLKWTPDHRQRFLGEFTTSTGPVRLRLDALPPHTYIRVAFDLYILKSWDGNAREAFGTPVGPDLWDLSVEGGPALVHTSFALFTRDGGRQAFPDDFPYGDHPHRTGAFASNSLGFAYERPMDASYHLDLAFPHTASALTLVFHSPGPPQEPWDESWGLDNVRVEALPKPPGEGLEEATLLQFCGQLGSEDPVSAQQAAWRLIGAGDRVIPLLSKTLMPPPADRERVRELIALLQNPRWTIREEAGKALKRLGMSAVPQIRETLTRPLPAETEIRLRDVIALSEADDSTHPDALRHARYIRILDVLGTPAAAGLLGTIAAEGPARGIREVAGAARERILRSVLQVNDSGAAAR